MPAPSLDLNKVFTYKFYDCFTGKIYAIVQIRDGEIISPVRYKFMNNTRKYISSLHVAGEIAAEKERIVDYELIGFKNKKKF